MAAPASWAHICCWLRCVPPIWQISAQSAMVRIRSRQTWSVTMIIARIPRDDASKDAAALSLESWNAGMHCLQYLSEEVATQSEGSEAPSDQD